MDAAHSVVMHCVWPDALTLWLSNWACIGPCSCLVTWPKLPQTKLDRLAPPTARHVATARHSSPQLATARHGSPRLATARHGSPRLATARTPDCGSWRLAAARGGLRTYVCMHAHAPTFVCNRSTDACKCANACATRATPPMSAACNRCISAALSLDCWLNGRIPVKDPPEGTETT